MQSFMGLLWALGGGVAGCIAGIAVSEAIIAITKASNREGAHGYLMVALGLVGAVIGLVVGLSQYGRSAPVGFGFAYFRSGMLGLLCLAAAIGLGIWAFSYFQERPVQYEGQAMADLLMELRIETARIPRDIRPTNWFGVEVQTSTTRPAGLVLWDQKRLEGSYSIFPVVEGPLYRSGSRTIVVTIEGNRMEAFIPPMKRVPDPKADWSPWYRPRQVYPYGVTPPSAPLEPVFELRYRVRKYGD